MMGFFLKACCPIRQQATRQYSDNLDRLGLRTFLAFSRHVRNALVLFEGFEARAHDVGVMCKEIFATGLRLDEAVAFFVVEPFNNTSFSLHFCNPLKI